METPKCISKAKRNALIALAVASFPWFTIGGAAVCGAGFIFHKCAGEETLDDDDSSCIMALDEDED